MHSHQRKNVESNYSFTFDKLKEIVADEWNPPERSFDEVYENLLIGDLYAATDLEVLKSQSVTHILNASQGKDTSRYVDTDEQYYKNLNYPCKFLGIPAMDVTAFQLQPYFHIATEFIDEGLKNSTKNGKVLVHCLQGISRSATLVIAYLMISQGIPVIQATQLVVSRRNIHPNDGFLEQLCHLEVSLRKTRNY